MALKITVGEIHKQHGSTPPKPTHYYHPGMKKIYGIDAKHFEQVFARWGALRRRLSNARQREIWNYRVARGTNSGFPDKFSSR